MSNISQTINEQIAANPIVLYMKGSKIFPQCGFSAQVAHILHDLNVDFLDVNVLENPEIRQELPKISGWPTFPQLYINGELIGGCDIVTELYQEHKLQDLLKQAKSS